jgi:type II secretory pathway pseudopilin PulG
MTPLKQSKNDCSTDRNITTVLRFRGFGLIETVVSIALMLVLFLALFGILRSSLTLSTLAKAKAAATELANSQIEYFHGLSYDAVGTIAGIPSGTVPQIATTTVDGVTYTVRTYIVYTDDVADGLGVLDTNGITTDYKMGKVTVSYSIYGLTKSVILASNFVPQGIETATNGGTISIHAVDADGADMSGATVQIINSAITPAVNFSTFTNIAGLSIIDGAATSTQYQIFVSRPGGYSSAQTYARTAQNVNPSPGYLTIARNQITSSTFAIDRLSTLILSSFSPATTLTFSDTFSDATNLASQTDTQVVGGSLVLTSQPYPVGYALSGSARSKSLSPSVLNGWGMLSASIATSTGTTVVVRVDDAAGTPLPDTVLPGNSAGFSTFPVSLTSLATSSYPSLALEAFLTTEATTTTPSLISWSLSHTEGLLPLPNVAFTLTGAKTIGTDGSGVPIYKTVVSDTTDGSGVKSKTIEWDAYALSLNLNLIESCPFAPYQLPPAVATTTVLLVGTPTSNVLPVTIVDSLGNSIGGAKVVLSKDSYAATVLTSPCGLAFFNSLNEGSYTATVSAQGYGTISFPNISVDGYTATTTLILP